jgi:prepilin-type N-terminal cleavage/methylation domain-containing protein
MNRQPYPRTHQKKAFTLIEVLMVSLIVPLLLMVIFIVMRGGDQVYSTVTVSMDIRQSSRNGMERILREVRESNASTITTISANADRISFTTPRFKDGSGVLVPIVYFLNTSGQIIREYPPNTRKPVAVDITGLKFLKTGPQLDIAISAAKASNRGLLTYSIKQKVRLRNE